MDRLTQQLINRNNQLTLENTRLRQALEDILLTTSIPTIRTIAHQAIGDQ